MTCLLGWFKSAPPGEDEMLDDEYPDALLYRKKICPCCRASVQSRPVPVYLVKSLASALDKAKTPAGVSRPSPPPDDEDPWKGIFRDRSDDAGDFWSDEDDDDAEDDDDEEGEEYDDSDDGWSYGTDEDEERYTGPHVMPKWAPPSVHIPPEDYPFLDWESNVMRMLRRGATLQMIEIFSMTYSHDTGLCAFVEDNTVFLGWNVELHPEDTTGEEYMDWVVADMYERPERWQVTERLFEGTWTATRLVPDEEDEHYDDTDSEAWAAELEDDGDDDEDEDM